MAGSTEAVAADDPTPSDEPSDHDDRVQLHVNVPGGQTMIDLVGPKDKLLRHLQRATSADLFVRGNQLVVSGPRGDAERMEETVAQLLDVLGRGQAIDTSVIDQTLRMVTDHPDEQAALILTETLLTHRGKAIRPRTVGQKRYLDKIRDNTVTFGIGPAGTGKTYLAMAAAVAALRARDVNRLILTRPAVEAGERLGFLPGTLHEKIDPYLKPLWDALRDMMEVEELVQATDRGTIEVAPLAYMRGRAQPVSERVLTPTGFVPIGDVVAGDDVIGSDGRVTEVIGVFPQGEKDVLRVTASDGASTRCCAEHLWTVWARRGRHASRAARTVETRAMIGKLRTARHRRFELPLVEPVELSEQQVPMDPYALGEALANARLGMTPQHRGGPDDVLSRIGRGTAVMTENPVTARMRDLDLLDAPSSTTSVPETYLHNSADVRLGVLQGLLDGDPGSVTQRGRTGRVQYTTRSPQLRDDVVWLAQSLGGTATTRVRPADRWTPVRAKGRPAEHGDDAFIVEIRLPDGVSPSRLTRNAEQSTVVSSARPRRFVASIEPDGREEMVCIRVAAEDQLYVTEGFLVTHNTLNDAFIVLDEAQNTTAEQMKMFLTRIGFGSKAVVTGDVSQVDLPGNQTSGLRIVRDILDGTDGVGFAMLKSADVVRHPIVMRIVEAYERYDKSEETDGRGRAVGRDDRGPQVRRGRV